jgi:cytochrome c peroxidase
MNKFIFTFISFLLIISCISFISLEKIHKIPFKIPKGWEKPSYNFKKNPLTEEGFELGRKLFYDPILSADSTISCASCHLQTTGFTHIDHELSHGIGGKIGTRNSPVLINLAWKKTFMLDGGVNHLDVQPIFPITSEVEMGESMENVVKKLNHSPKYRKLFQKTFGDSLITGQKTLLALSQFLVQLTSYNAKYDKFIRKEKGGEFTEQERNGLTLFRKHCASCHKEPLFTNDHFENNGLLLDTGLRDLGRMKITQKSADSLKFKVPTLRNIQFSKPYMHDGRFKKLLDVMNHYTNGIQKSSTLAKELQQPITLTQEEKIDIIAFLFTLSDKDFLFDKRFSFPMDK